MSEISRLFSGTWGRILFALCCSQHQVEGEGLGGGGKSINLQSLTLTETSLHIR
jgi:hypothetical protein